MTKKAAPTNALAVQVTAMEDDTTGPIPDRHEMVEDVGSSSRILHTKHQMTGRRKRPAQDAFVEHSRKKRSV